MNDAQRKEQERQARLISTKQAEQQKENARKAAERWNNR